MKKAFVDLLSSSKLNPDAKGIVDRFIYHLKYNYGKDQHSATPMDCYLSFASAVRDLLIDRWITSQQEEYAHEKKRVYYLSLEYLIGRSLNNAILNLDIDKSCRNALSEIGYDLSMLTELEWDAGLGNGGLGRLAACFLDSLSTLKIPAFGYGIRYEYGIFSQQIKNGVQIEAPDNWLRYGSVWEIPQPERLFPVYFGGYVHQFQDESGVLKCHWKHGEYVMAMAYDYLMPGYHNNFANTLRLWSAKSTRDFNLNYFNAGDYVQAVADKNHSEMISKVLYPNDENMQGKELRLKQEYFFVSATLQDILRRFSKKHQDWNELPKRVAIQLNDTHPAVAIADLMRILVDEKKLSWEKAWEITQASIAYTNHTILPEALEKWTVSLFEKVLPRHLQIIYEINQRFLNSINLDVLGQDYSMSDLSIIEEQPVRSVRMAHLSAVGAFSINGVSELHTELLKSIVFPQFHRVFPDKFNNKTNGITPRRWLQMANPRLSELISSAIGDKWIADLNDLKRLDQFINDKQFLSRWGDVKRKNKIDFADYLFNNHSIKVDPESIFDFQAKRIHEYKRQLLNALHIIHVAFKIKDSAKYKTIPHTYFFAGKAAPGYYLAKLIINLINAIADWVERDETLSGKLKVVFLPNYRVTLAERIMPASEVSQQISTAGTEASGTGNMKFALNGALTIGTLDGANIEIREAVGAENFFLFGMTADEVIALKHEGYNPYAWMQADDEIKRVIDFLLSDTLTPSQPGLFRPIVELLLYHGDEYCIIADFQSYVQSMRKLELSYQDYHRWNVMSVSNTMNMGKFSSDETIKRYAKEIWKI